MDSLIVLRKPLRGSHFGPKFPILKKPKKAAPNVEPIPPEPNLEDEANEPTISFVKLYEDLCLEKSRSAQIAVHVASPDGLHGNTPAQRSASSLLTRYRECSGGDMSTYHQVFCDTTPPSSSKVELMFELDYNTCFKDLENS